MNNRRYIKRLKKIINLLYIIVLINITMQTIENKYRKKINNVLKYILEKLPNIIVPSVGEIRV